MFSSKMSLREMLTHPVCISRIRLEEALRLYGADSRYVYEAAMKGRSLLRGFRQSVGRLHKWLTEPAGGGLVFPDDVKTVVDKCLSEITDQELSWLFEKARRTGRVRVEQLAAQGVPHKKGFGREAADILRLVVLHAARIEDPSTLHEQPELPLSPPPPPPPPKPPMPRPSSETERVRDVLRMVDMRHRVNAAAGAVAFKERAQELRALLAYAYDRGQALKLLTTRGKMQEGHAVWLLDKCCVAWFINPNTMPSMFLLQHQLAAAEDALEEMEIAHAARAAKAICPLKA